MATERKALCAWCSISENTPKGWDGEFTTCFPELHREYPELVDENGCGWYIWHIRTISNLAEQCPKTVKASVRALFPEKLSEYVNQWRKKVRQFLIPIFQESTDAIWQLRFDDIIAAALTLGPLWEMEVEVTGTVIERSDMSYGSGCYRVLEKFLRNSALLTVAFFFLQGTITKIFGEVPL